MDVKEYFKIKNRMTNKCSMNCLNCPLSSSNNGKKLSCPDFENTYPDIAVEIVEKWNKEHPITSNLNEFEKEVEKYIKNTFKDIELNLYCSTGMPNILCGNFNYCDECKKFWNSECKKTVTNETGLNYKKNNII